ncbi:hypothetical protein [Bradyrhizobium sp. 162]|uniref:hypothetical protein n=1 Tax=Bradyrhizobium sp. 162 TaxID=2782635 RepID=UPI001FF89F47|nr:hypothetical protein [Bradyrhizobium sp. 162]MCK1634690.1 hypothetical protein [Bradyrhizobium sp. 162]
MMAAEASAFKRYEEGLRPGLIENKQVDMVPSLDDRRLADLIYQLDRDVALRGKETDIHKSSRLPARRARPWRASCAT